MPTKANSYSSTKERNKPGGTTKTCRTFGVLRAHLAPFYGMYVRGGYLQTRGVQLVHVHGISQGRPEREQGPHPVHEEQDHVHPETFRAGGWEQQQWKQTEETYRKREKATNTDQEGAQLQLQLRRYSYSR